MGRRFAVLMLPFLAGCVTTESGELVPLWQDPDAGAAVKEGVGTAVDTFLSNGDITVLGIVGALAAGGLTGWKVYQKRKATK